MRCPPTIPLWQTARGPIVLDRPIILGVVNVTPDSFSDAGRYDSVDAAVARASTAPTRAPPSSTSAGVDPSSAVPVPAAEELRRVVPSIRRS
jgi:dihydropteroate synthase